MRIILLLILPVSLALIAAGCFASNNKDEPPHAVMTYEIPDASQRKELIESGKPVNMFRYYEMSDGTWKTDEYTYKYRVEVSGRLHSAVKDTTYVILTNESDAITFEQAWRSQLSSDMKEHFDKERTIIVAMG